MVRPADLPRPVADLHVHSVASGHAYSTVLELVRAARERGISVLALTDHGPAMPGGPHLYHFGNLKAIPPRLEGVRVLRGVEANILDHRGSLDLPTAYLERLEWVLASLHPVSYAGGGPEENTRALLAVLDNPHVHVLAHLGNPAFPCDLEQVVRRAAERGVAVELNNSSLTISRPGSRRNCQLVAAAAARSGGPVSLGSDAHGAWSVGELGQALELALAAGVRVEQILNLAEGRVEEFLRAR
jgi:putative hydrolase